MVIIIKKALSSICLLGYGKKDSAAYSTKGSYRPIDRKLEKVLIEEDSAITIPLPNIRVYFKCDNKASFKKRINEKLLRRPAKKGREG